MFQNVPHYQPYLKGIRVGLTWRVYYRCDSYENELNVRTFNNEVTIK